jgi:hypothetical protein
MPDQKAYLRFNHGITGRSRYRPCEGWIDVLSHSPDDRPGVGSGAWGRREVASGAYRFTIGGSESVIPLIAQASADASHFATVVLDAVSGNKTLRMTMTDVHVESVRHNEVFEFTLAYKEKDLVVVAAGLAAPAAAR